MQLDDLRNLFFVFPLAIVLFLIYRLIRYGGIVGGILGVRPKELVGSVESEKAGGMRQVFRVHLLESELGQGTSIALQTTTFAWGSRKITASRLTAAQARELAALLTRAATR